MVIGIDLDGNKDVLGMWIGENESAKFWLSVLNDLKNRGVQDILITCVDNLTGFSQAITACYPKTEIQKCIIHQIRNSTRYVSYKDLKPMYKAATEEMALVELDRFEETWGAKYPLIIRSWRSNWDELATFFKYPELRKLIYTTNMIESYHRQLRKVTKGKSIFPSDEALLRTNASSAFCVLSGSDRPAFALRADLPSGEILHNRVYTKLLTDPELLIC